ncbi:MAG: hypothetical protein PHV20_00320 [Bacteroidales bacterium]|nr:hypothetical protein [Bacteroidales bacterium]
MNKILISIVFLALQVNLLTSNAQTIDTQIYQNTGTNRNADIVKKHINIDVLKSNEICLNGKLVTIDKIVSKIKNVTFDYSVADKATFIINLTIDKDIKMGVIADIKAQLKKANASRVVLQIK